ncbi:SCO7613 C-terminal domain-containing membrane protein [Agromyces sp. NPDC004153]
MATRWSELTVRYLRDTAQCPRCDAELLGASTCPECRADLGGAAGAEFRAASQRAADALEERDRYIAALPTISAVAAFVATAGAAASPSAARTPDAGTSEQPSAVVDHPASVAGAPASQVSVPSVLAVAGAGLIAVAAVVFALLNPDVGFAMRTSVIAAVTVVFVAGAWLLRRRGVTFSAEAIGSLGLVFLALDAQAASELVPYADAWSYAALGTLAGSLVLLALAWFARIRVWLWAAGVGLTLVPAFLGYSAGGQGVVMGHVGVVAVVLAVHVLVDRLAPRFASPLRAEHTTLGVLQLIATLLAVGQLPFLGATEVGDTFFRAAVMLTLALGAALGAAHVARRGWSFVAGGLAAGGVAVLPLALVTLDPSWSTTLVPAGAAAVVAGTGVLGNGVRGPIRARAAQAGALSVLLLLLVPASLIATTTIVRVPLDAAAEILDTGTAARFVAGTTSEIAAALGLLVAAVGIAALAWFTRRAALASESRFPVHMLCLASWLGVAAALTVVAWHGLTPLSRSMIGIGIAVLATLVVVTPRSRFASAGSAVRAPFVVLAHVGLVEAALVTWTEAWITVPVGVVAIAAALLVARCAPRVLLPVYVGVAFGYGLVLVGTALDLAGLETIPVLCLTTTVASLGALVATLVRRVEPPEWYAILIVTAIPFLIGVATVVWERSGWTALSTGVTFLLALTLVITRRPGLNAVVRSGAAALLVPSLAVVVVCLGAEFLEISGAPVTLPIIAGIVAITLSAIARLASELRRRGLGLAQAAAVTVAIESSALVTGAIAVLLALVREAAGLGTATAVFVLIGLGGAGARALAGRRYGWWLAGASWTGALWCVWAMLGMVVVEPYTLPPAIAAGVVAAALVASGRTGVGLFAAAIACGLLPSLVALAWVGNGGADVPWRLIGLLAASVALLVVGGALTPGRDGDRRRLDGLRLPLLLGSIAAAAAGPVQAVRLGLGVDPSPTADPDLVMLPALGLSVAGAGLAAAAAWLVGVGARRVEPPTRLEVRLRATRWLLAPAAVYLVAGPITAIRPDWVAIWTLWALMAGLLVTALVAVGTALRRRPVLPPFAFLYALAWITGVTAWSMRDLRVEFFSLPLGVTVLAAGIMAMRPAAIDVRPTLASWPIGFRGSWRLLAPGIVLTLLPSVLATGTDPQLYRPIMVIALALAAILIGSSRKLAAPFILGIAVLPVENVVVFAAQLDRTVGAMPWWITLATAGAVLLTIAVGYERRSAQGLGVAARLRELE